MEPTYLIQRLRRPKPGQESAASPYAFGGGYRNGGLKDEIMGRMVDICRFEYMGASQFEHGALVECFHALRDMASAGTLTVWTVNAGAYAYRVDKGYADDWSDDLEEEPVYIMGDSTHKEELSRRICELAQTETTGSEDSWSNSGNVHTQTPLEYVGLLQALCSRKRGEVLSKIPVGWIELDNGFIFSVDSKMIDKFAEMFGIPAEHRELTPVLETTF